MFSEHEKSEEKMREKKFSNKKQQLSPLLFSGLRTIIVSCMVKGKGGEERMLMMRMKIHEMDERLSRDFEHATGVIGYGMRFQADYYAHT